MFDISWTEFLLIGVVALIVIGPKELPGVLRTLGQYTRKVRGMAAEFQSQFQEAMREAEMTDLKKQVDDMAHDFKNYDPLKDVRSDVEAMSKDIERSFDTPAEPTTQPPAAASEPGSGTAPALETAPPPAIEHSEGETPAPDASDAANAAPAAETAPADGTERPA
jgi:sec-independent protein translocase protein TatB